MSDEKEKSEKILLLLKQGKKLNDIIKEDHQLIDGLQEFIEEINRGNLRASVVSKLFKKNCHNITTAAI
jgi:hypothetical protein